MAIVYSSELCLANGVFSAFLSPLTRYGKFGKQKKGKKEKMGLGHKHESFLGVIVMGLGSSHSSPQS